MLSLLKKHQWILAVSSVFFTKNATCEMTVGCCCWKWHESNHVWSRHHPSLPYLHPFFTSLPLCSLNFSIFCFGHVIMHPSLPCLHPFFTSSSLYIPLYLKKILGVFVYSFIFEGFQPIANNFLAYYACSVLHCCDVTYRQQLYDFLQWCISCRPTNECLHHTCCL